MVSAFPPLSVGYTEKLHTEAWARERREKNGRKVQSLFYQIGGYRVLLKIPSLMVSNGDL